MLKLMEKQKQPKEDAEIANMNAADLLKQS